MKKELIVYPCYNTKNSNQYWYFTDLGEIRIEDKCMDYFSGKIHLEGCHSGKGNQLWTLKSDSKQISHNLSGLCLTVKSRKNPVAMEKCEPSKQEQMWLFEKFNPNKQ